MITGFAMLSESTWLDHGCLDVVLIFTQYVHHVSFAKFRLSIAQPSPE